MLHPLLLLGWAALGAEPVAVPPLTLSSAVREALAHNPTLAHARATVDVDAAGVKVAGALPELSFSYQAWQQPLAQPVDPTATNMHMFGLRQALPFPGQLGLAQRAAEAGVEADRATARATRLGVEAQVAHALVAYWLQGEELRIHLAHMALSQQMLEAVQGRYASGGATQADLLGAETALHRLHADIAGIQASTTAAVALLDALLGRAPGEPLPPAAEPETSLPEGEQERPEVIASRLRVEQAKRGEALARRAQLAPDLMLGLDYMLVPHLPDAYSVMVQVGLPWISGKRRAETEQAQRQVAEAEAAEAEVRNAAGYEVVARRAQASARRDELAVLERDVLPRAEHALEAARSSYLAGNADLVALLAAQSALLDTQLSIARQRAGLADAVAELRRALGIDLVAENDHE